MMMLTGRLSFGAAGRPEYPTEEPLSVVCGWTWILRVGKRWDMWSKRSWIGKEMAK